MDYLYQGFSTLVYFELINSLLQGTILCIIGYWAASLVPAHQKPFETPSPPSCDNQKFG